MSVFSFFLILNDTCSKIIYFKGLTREILLEKFLCILNIYFGALVAHALSSLNSIPFSSLCIPVHASLDMPERSPVSNPRLLAMAART